MTAKLKTNEILALLNVPAKNDALSKFELLVDKNSHKDIIKILFNFLKRDKLADINQRPEWGRS
jgi:hypothetical protein